MKHAREYVFLGHRQRGVTLMDTIVGTALMLVIFMGIAGVFQLSVDVVTNNKARGSAIALSNERMEYMRSITYASLGTTGGIPSGSIAQSETVVLNGITFTRRTFIEYADDPKDGTGALDSNSITSDYKVGKVDVAWTSRNGVRHITLVSRFQPPAGMEIACTPPCGTLTLSAVDANSQVLAGASVSIVNPSTTPAVSISTFTNASGTASFIGAPASAGYQITVTKSGYSTAQTYSPTAQNTNPNPGHLTVSNNQTTSGTFAIDVLGQKTIQTWMMVLPATWTDAFADSTKIATSATTTVASGVARLTGSSGTYPATGTFQSVSIAPASLNRWTTFTASTSTPAQTAVRFSFYDGTGATLIPDSAIPGNSAGIATSSVSLLGVSTSTYPSLRIGATLSSSNSAVTPSVDSYSVAYEYGPTPLPNIAFTLGGAKSIGTGPSGTVYKYGQSLNTGVSSAVVVPNLEWDTYTISLNGTTTGYDIASSCPGPQPETLVAGASTITQLFLGTHTVNSLLVDVRSGTTSALLPNFSVNLWRSGYNATSTTDSCGQTFFSGITSSASYSIRVSAPGYTSYTATNISVGGTDQISVTIN